MKPCPIFQSIQGADAGYSLNQFESPDLLMPHGPAVRDSNRISELTLIILPAVLQADHSPRVIAHQHHVSPAIGEPTVLR